MRLSKIIPFNTFGLNLSRFSIFSFLWAFQTLEEETDQFLNPARFSIVLCASLLLLMPRSALLFVLFCLLHINNFFAHSPVVVNHYIPITLINVGLLFLFIREFIKTSSIERIDKNKILDRISPTVRWLVCGVYFFAAFHKLNWGFFDTNNSCFVYIYDTIQLLMPIIPNFSSWAINIGIPATILIEAGIPLLLMFRKTRPFGLIIGVLFHLFLGLGFPSFSTMIFILYLFFIPPETLDRLHELYANSKLTRKICKWIPPIILSCVLFFWYLPWWYLPRDFVRAFMHLTWFYIFTGLFLFGFLFIRKLPLSSFTSPISWKLKPGYWIFIILLVINGISPYLGIKLAPAFSMYSNLMTEEGYHNHILVPEKIIQIVDYQDDLVEILESNYPPLQEIAHRNRLIPFIILQRLISHNAAKEEFENINLTYRRNNKVFSYKNAENDPLLSKKQSWLFRKFTNFRYVPPPGENVCQW